MFTFKTVYTDKKGAVHACVESDGSSLKINLRDITFGGTSFDALQPLGESLKEAKLRFSLDQDDCLTDCTLFVTIPLFVNRNGSLVECLLHVEIMLGVNAMPMVSRFSVTIDEVAYDVVTNENKQMYFEHLLIALQKLILDKGQLHSCLFCALSHYSIAGSDNYGSLICFREVKDKILSVTGKEDYAELLFNNGFQVQETFHCPAFTEITPALWLYKHTIYDTGI